MPQTQIVPFAFEGTNVRTVTIDGEAWFVARDVANILGYADPVNAIKQHCRGVANHHPIEDALGRMQPTRILSEADVMRLIINSKMPAAENFERWVFDDVLPEIRRTGSYGHPADDLALPQNYVEALEALLTREKANLALERENAELTPRATAWDAIASAEGDYSVGEAAKMLAHAGIPNMGPQRLFSRLEDIGWTFRAAGTWQAKADRVEKGFLSIKPQFHYHPGTGARVIDPPQVRVTLKGVEQLRRRLGGGNGAIQAVAS